MKTNLVLCSTACLFGTLTTTQAQVFESNSDLWDVSQGTMMTGNSALNPAAGIVYDTRDAFGGSFGTFPTQYLNEQGNVIYDDNRGAGFVHFLEWKTTTPVTVAQFNVFGYGDNLASQREFTEFRLLAKSSGSLTYNLILYSYTPSTHPYTYADPANAAIISAIISPTTAQEFRAEFVDSGFGGPRISELDAYSPIPEPSAYAAIAGLGLLGFAIWSSRATSHHTPVR